MPQLKEAMAPVIIPISNEQKIISALGNLEATNMRMHDLRKSLSRLQKKDYSLLPDTRMLKVHMFSRTNGRKPTIYCPEIVLRGNWLEKAGFSFDDQWVHVISMDEMLVITPESKFEKMERLK